MSSGFPAEAKRTLCSNAHKLQATHNMSRTAAPTRNIQTQIKTFKIHHAVHVQALMGTHSLSGTWQPVFQTDTLNVRAHKSTSTPCRAHKMLHHAQKCLLIKCHTRERVYTHIIALKIASSSPSEQTQNQKNMLCKFPNHPPSQKRTRLFSIVYNIMSLHAYIICTHLVQIICMFTFMFLDTLPSLVVASILSNVWALLCSRSNISANIFAQVEYTRWSLSACTHAQRLPLY